MIHTRNMSNREPSISLKGVSTSYTSRPCPTCGFIVHSPIGQQWACVICQYRAEQARAAREIEAYNRMDAILGTEPITDSQMESMVELFMDGTDASPIISGGEVLDLCKPSPMSDDESMPF